MKKMERRDFLKSGTLTVAAGVAAVAAALSPLKDLDTDHLEGFFQQHYKELTPGEMKAVLKRISDKVEEEYEVRPDLRDIKPLDGVQFAYALNLTRCIGCRKCVHACVRENNQSRSPEIQYIRVLEMPQGTMDLEKGNHTYSPEKVPREDHFYMPVQCHQCENAPCTKACPVEATWKEPDGIVVVDYNWCIGCRYCEAACPYWARRFNFGKPELPKEDLNPKMAYLSNRPRHLGVMEKCTFCLQRTRVGLMPACLEVCPMGARIFGNVLDPESTISMVLKEKRVFVLKEDTGTIPRFFYFFDK
jgi:molybdopterin-containing oxidoreductase family iron-sulfur binding subunit